MVNRVKSYWSDLKAGKSTEQITGKPRKRKSKWTDSTYKREKLIQTDRHYFTDGDSEEETDNEFERPRKKRKMK